MYFTALMRFISIHSMLLSEALSAPTPPKL
jgi:hypothetical protein